MVFELKSKRSHKIEIDEDAILDLFVNLGIDRDEMEVDFDVHYCYTPNDGVMIIDFKNELTDEMKADIEAMLVNEFSNSGEISEAYLAENSDDEFSRVIINFRYPIYNENEDY